MASKELQRKMEQAQPLDLDTNKSIAELQEKKAALKASIVKSAKRVVEFTDKLNEQKVEFTNKLNEQKERVAQATRELNEQAEQMSALDAQLLSLKGQLYQ